MRLRSTHLRTFVIIAGLVIVVQTVSGIRPFDDAYITYRYARNLVQGLGLVYNPGERVLGTTTPLYTLLLAGGAWITASYAIPVLSFLFTVAADVVSATVLFNLTERATHSRWPAWITVLVWIFHPLRVDVSTGGMETSVFTMLLLLSYDRFLRDRPSYATAVFLAWALLTRPEAIFAIVPIGLAWLVHDARRAFWAAVLGSFILIPWVVWATVYYGGPLPNSITAKVVAYSDHLVPAAHSLLTFFSTGSIGVYPFTPITFVSLIASVSVYTFGLIVIVQRLPRWLTFAIFPLLYTVTMLIVNAPLTFGWYFPPLLPSLLFTIIAGVWLFSRMALRLRQSLISVISVMAIITPLVYQHWTPSWILVHDTDPPTGRECTIDGVPNIPNQLVFALDIGKIGYCLNQSLILDGVGLVSPQAIPYLTSGARTMFNPRLIEDFRPNYIIAMEQWIDPLIHDGNLLQDYKIVRQNTVNLQGGSQRLYVLKRISMP